MAERFSSEAVLMRAPIRLHSREQTSRNHRHHRAGNSEQNGPSTQLAGYAHTSPWSAVTEAFGESATKAATKGTFRHHPPQASSVNGMPPAAARAEGCRTLPAAEQPPSADE